jgi:tetratricopeptide (TPR) repeat protein
VALWEEAMPFLVAAARVYGTGVLAGAPDVDTAAGVGRGLLRGIFGARAADGQVPEPLGALVARPDDPGAQEGVAEEVAGALHDDAALAAAVVATLTGYYRREIEGGNTGAMIQLGELLRDQDDLDGARGAYQQAIDRGDVRGMLSLARLLRGDVGDAEGARAWFQRAIDSGDADLAAEATVDLGHLLVIFQRDADGAQAAFQRAIDSGHPEWAPAAMNGLAGLRMRQRDSAGARAACQRAADSGNRDQAARALTMLGNLLRKDGDTDAARVAYMQVIDSRHADWAPPALGELLNLLREEDDLDGARAAHRKAVETGNPEARYALVVIGQLLDQRGDPEGARAAFREAGEAGDEWADELLTRLDRKDEPARAVSWEEEKPADLPPQFAPRHMAETGIAVLEGGLPELPEALTYQMSVPMAYWKAEQCAVVLFLQFHRNEDGGQDPVASMGTYSRDEGQWIAHRWWMGTGFSPDPIARPGDLRHLDGQPITVSGHCWSTRPAPGHPAMVVHGQVGPGVTDLVLAQDGREDRRRLDSRFGAWVVCIEQASPFQIIALDENGSELGRLEESIPPEDRFHFPPGSE